MRKIKSIMSRSRLFRKIFCGIEARDNWIQRLEKRIHKLEIKTESVLSMAPYLLRAHYSEIGTVSDTKTFLRLREFKVYSQHGEDGILLYLFSKIGVTRQSFVEIGIETGRECNTANLLQHFGWHGLWIDGNKEYVQQAKNYYHHHPAISSNTITMVREFITAENVNTVLSANGQKGEIDLLSIDIDGNDYWVWDAITAVDPRVVVIEYNASFGAEKSMSIPYDPAFIFQQSHWSRHYHGASLRALAHLGDKKGYQLVCCDSSGVNAFFVRKDLVDKITLKPLSVAEAYYAHAERLRHYSVQQQFALIQHLPFATV